MPSLIDHISTIGSLVKDSVRTQGVANKRSPHWPACEKAHLKAQPTCQACGSGHSLQVHHMKPFHLYPALELDPTNLLTLCENSVLNCHLKIGHLDNWKNYNASVVSDAAQSLLKKSQATAAAATITIQSGAVKVNVVSPIVGTK